MLRQTRKEDRKKGIKSNRKKRNKKLKKTREKEKKQHNRCNEKENGDRMIFIKKTGNEYRQF